MSLTPLFGHQSVRERLARAITADRLPQVLLLTGPAGIGKQRLGLWLAERLLCERATGTEPCGGCASCRQVSQLAHPDLHWFVPVVRPKTDGDRQLDEVGELLEAAMAERRASGTWEPPSGMVSHGLASARLLLREASLSAAQGGWRIFLLGHAERLVVQESSPEAANALLKLLEEPPARTLFILTAPEPGLVLTTIRSRAVPVRLGPVADQDVAAWLAASGTAVDPVAVRAAGGAIGRFGQSDRTRRDRGQALLDAAQRGADARAMAALQQGVSQARGDFTELLDGLADALSDRTRAAADHSDWAAAAADTAGIGLVLEARERAQGNVNPQLALAALLNDLAELTPR